MAPTSSKRSKSSSKSKHNALSSASLKNFFKLEDDLCKHLDTDKICDDVRKILTEIRSNSNTIQDKPPTHSKTNHEKNSALILAVKLRNLNRLFTFRNKQANTKLSDVRQKVEDHYLSLQNVSSEIAHMKKNIENCLDFRADIDDIELVNAEELSANSSKEMDNQEEEEKLDDHQLFLQRLNHELNERKSLLSNLNELEGRKSALLSDIKGKEQRLSQIGPKIVSIKKVIFD
uniref:t-SNARE coiled-coil homology domain-containing protein n=1 Tax=Meloidogyne hapla TaxID=6305 RepID=A0A1I8B3E4_MELHA